MSVSKPRRLKACPGRSVHVANASSSSGKVADQTCCGDHFSKVNARLKSWLQGKGQVHLSPPLSFGTMSDQRQKSPAKGQPVF